MSYRVDWLDDNKVTAVALFSAERAWKRYVEGVMRACDEVTIYEFVGGKSGTILLAQHRFNRKGIAAYGPTEEIKAQAADGCAEASLQKGAQGTP